MKKGPASRIITFILILCVCFAALPMVIVILRSPEQAPVLMQGGEADLEKELAGNANRIYQLKGQWEYYPDKLYTYSDFLYGDSIEPEVAAFPHIWTAGGGRPAKGCATYRARVKIPANIETISILSLNQYSAYRIYLNEFMVSQAGRLDPFFNNFTMGFYSLSGHASLNLKEGYPRECNVIIQVQNELHALPGLRGRVFLSGLRQISSLESAMECVNNFTIGAIAVMILYLTGMFFSNRKRTEDADYALASFLLLWYILLNTGGSLSPYRFIQGSLGWMDKLLLRLEYYLPALASFFSMRHVLRKNLPRRAMGGVYLAVALIPSVHLWVPIPVFTNHLLFNIVIIILICITPSVIDLINLCRRRRREKWSIDSVLTYLTHILLFVAPLAYIFSIGFWFGIYGFAWINIIHLILQIMLFMRYYQHLEDEVRMLNQDLEVKVNERTRALQVMTREAETARHKAEDAQRLAEDASRHKSEFLAKMSHEICTPLNAIINMSDLIETGGFSEAQRQYFRNMERMSHTLLRLVNGILDFSEIDAGKVKLAPSHYNLRSLFDSVASMQGFLAGEKGLDFQADFTPGLDEVVYGDEARVHQICTNLVNNAVKYTRKGYVHFSMSAAIVAARGGAKRRCIKIMVSDSGVGIKDDQKKRLFVSFEQLDRKRTQGVQGAGLGLAITKQLLDLMGGAVTVKSVYGEGSIFSAFIPLVKGDPAKVVLGAGKDDTVQAAADVKVLVVDDLPINLSVALGYLARHGIKADTAESGAEALARVKARRYDLIFMDHMMPDMDGIETVKRLRSLGADWLKTVPVVSFSANAVQGARELFVAAGMNDFIAKPLRPGELNRVLGRWLPPDKIRAGK
ncbi:MAG: response regulator [Treponema sp.]|nr:response regulator [Treponema sp.]